MPYFSFSIHDAFSSTSWLSAPGSGKGEGGGGGGREERGREGGREGEVRNIHAIFSLQLHLRKNTIHKLRADPTHSPSARCTARAVLLRVSDHICRLCACLTPCIPTKSAFTAS